MSMPVNKKEIRQKLRSLPIESLEDVITYHQMSASRHQAITAIGKLILADKKRAANRGVDYEHSLAKRNIESIRADSNDGSYNSSNVSNERDSGVE